MNATVKIAYDVLSAPKIPLANSMNDHDQWSAASTNLSHSAAISRSMTRVSHSIVTATGPRQSHGLIRLLRKAYEWDDTELIPLRAPGPGGFCEARMKKSACAVLLTFAGRASPEGRRHGGAVAPVAVLRRVARAHPSGRRGAAKPSWDCTRIG